MLEFTANQEKIDKTKFCLIYNSVDAGRFPASENTSALREKYGLPIEGYIVGSVGSLISKKGHEVLIEAAAILSKDITDLKVIIVGEGGRKDDLVALASKLGLGKRVVFMGPRDDVPQMMKMMDIFVLPSFQEGFPRTVIEAMYTEIPVVATNISGIPEIISDGDNGILIPAGDANAIAQKCLMLYRNPGLRKSIGINAKKKVESGYMPQDYSCRLEGLYSECLKEKARA